MANMARGEEKEGKAMSNALVEIGDVPYRIKKHTGRKKVRGALEFDRGGRICWVLGYCNRCNGKVTATREEMDSLKLSVNKQRKKLSYRLLKHLLKRYEE